MEDIMEWNDHSDDGERCSQKVAERTIKDPIHDYSTCFLVSLANGCSFYAFFIRCDMIVPLSPYICAFIDTYVAFPDKNSVVANCGADVVHV